MIQLFLKPCSLVQALEFTFDLLLMGITYTYVVRMLNRGKQRASQLYHCCSLLTNQDLCLIHIQILDVSCIGVYLYSKAASSHLQHLDSLQTCFNVIKLSIITSSL